MQNVNRSRADIFAGRVTSICDSTSAIAGIQRADYKLSQFRAVNANAERWAGILAGMSEEDRKIASAMAGAGTNVQTCADDSRHESHKLYKGIIGGIRKSLEKFDDSYFENADDAQLQAVSEYCLNLYNAFPHAFPMREGEKRP